MEKMGLSRGLSLKFLPNRCQRLISRVAHRAIEGGKLRIERVAPL